MNITKQKPFIEVKKHSISEWEQISLVRGVSHWVDPAITYLSAPELLITIEFIGGNEMGVYDIRMNGGQSLREQWDTSECR